MKRISIYVDENEYSQYQTLAEQLGGSAADYIRNATAEYLIKMQSQLLSKRVLELEKEVAELKAVSV